MLSIAVACFQLHVVGKYSQQTSLDSGMDPPDVIVTIATCLLVQAGQARVCPGKQASAAAIQWQHQVVGGGEHLMANPCGAPVTIRNIVIAHVVTGLAQISTGPQSPAAGVVDDAVKIDAGHLHTGPARFVEVGTCLAKGSADKRGC